MKDLCESERPREKMFSLGAKSLGTGELLSLLLGSGTKKENALEVAQKLLGSCDGSLTQLFNMSMEELQGCSGIGPGKAAVITAATELGKRFLKEKPTIGNAPLMSARMVYDMMIPVLKGLDHEECWAVWLNSRNFSTGQSRVNVGAGSATLIDIRRITRMALEKKAAGMFLVHNHPGGNPQPSTADIQQTAALRESLRAIDVRLLDHVIVADLSFYSFATGDTMKAIGQMREKNL